jgi:hypothetical protein
MPGKTRKQTVFSKTVGDATGRPRELREPVQPEDEVVPGTGGGVQTLEDFTAFEPKR